jgi:hypothetical protein
MMDTINLINTYFESLSSEKRDDMMILHRLILSIKPDCRLWFLDGKNEEGKVVANPNVGYGQYTIRYADGSTKPFFQVGISANTAGISVYVMDLTIQDDLIELFAEKIGKAKLTSYCIKFKTLKSINLDVLKEAILLGLSDS